MTRATTCCGCQRYGGELVGIGEEWGHALLVINAGIAAEPGDAQGISVLHTTPYIVAYKGHCSQKLGSGQTQPHLTTTTKASATITPAACAAKEPYTT